MGHQKKNKKNRNTNSDKVINKNLQQQTFKFTFSTKLPNVVPFIPDSDLMALFYTILWKILHIYVCVRVSAQNKEKKIIVKELKHRTISKTIF